MPRITTPRNLTLEIARHLACTLRHPLAPAGRPALKDKQPRAITKGAEVMVRPNRRPHDVREITGSPEAGPPGVEAREGSAGRPRGRAGRVGGGRPARVRRRWAGPVDLG